MNFLARHSPVLLLLLMSTAQGPGEEWTRFRGPNGSGGQHGPDHPGPVGGTGFQLASAATRRGTFFSGAVG